MRLIIFSQPSVFIRGHLHAQLEHGWWHRAITIPPRKLRTFAQTPLGYGLYSLFLIFGCFLISCFFYYYVPKVPVPTRNYLVLGLNRSTDPQLPPRAGFFSSKWPLGMPRGGGTSNPGLFGLDGAPGGHFACFWLYFV